MTEKLKPCYGGTEHTEIWLEPICAEGSPDGRLWCQDDVFEPCEECGAKQVRFVREDIANTRATGWRPIEEAPKDGGEFLAWPSMKPNRAAALCCWDSGNRCWYHVGVGHLNGLWHPTHFQEITPPSSEAPHD